MKFPVCSLLALIASARGSQLVSGGGVRGQSRFLQGGGGDGGGGRGPPPDDGEDGGGGGGGGGFTTCSTNLAQISGVTRPSNGTCADFEVGVTYPYPEVRVPQTDLFGVHISITHFWGYPLTTGFWRRVERSCHLHLPCQRPSSHHLERHS